MISLQVVGFWEPFCFCLPYYAGSYNKSLNSELKTGILLWYPLLAFEKEQPEASAAASE